MKVYIVVGENYDWTEIGEVFFDKQLAEETAAEKNKFKGIWSKHTDYGILEKEILDEKPITKKDKLAIRIEGDICFDEKSEINDIYCGVAEDWCETRFDDIDYFISAEIYIKTTEEEFDLPQEEIKQKYLPIWEEICSYAKQLKNEDIPIEDIAEKLEEKYKVEWW